jgi:ABC-type uncharacterized transport system auxiliary subunit
MNMLRAHAENLKLRTPVRFFKTSGLVLLLALVLAGCGQSPALIQQYVFEYAPPAAPASAKIDATLAVKRFAVAQAFNSTAMVYQPAPLKTATYNYNRWRVNPGYLVSDYLARDLRQAGFFKAVFSQSDAAQSRFVLEGGVEEIQELDEADGWKAAMALTVTLLDTSRDEVPQRLMFQKAYRTTEAMTTKDPQGLAEAMSRAMQRLSQEIITEVHAAVRKTSPQPTRTSRKAAD